MVRHWSSKPATRVRSSRPARMMQPRCYGSTRPCQGLGPGSTPGGCSRLSCYSACVSVKYTREVLAKAVDQSRSMADVLRKLGVKNYSGSLHNHLRRKISEFGIDDSALNSGRGWAKGSTNSTRKLPAHQILVRRESGSARAMTYQLRRALLESGVPHCCANCGNDGSWNGQALRLQIDHRDGDHANHELGNLRFLCPNCHSQTPTYGKRRKNN